MGQNDVTWGQASSTGMPPNLKSNQSWVTNLSLYKHCLLRNLPIFRTLQNCNVLWYKPLRPTIQLKLTKGAPLRWALAHFETVAGDKHSSLPETQKKVDSIDRFGNDLHLMTMPKGNANQVR